MAPDEELKEMAEKALNYTFMIIDNNMFHGVMSSSYGRAYEESLKAREQIEPNFLQWVTTGEGHLTLGSRAVTLYCLSDYIPPVKKDVISSKEYVSIELDQGVNRVKTYTFKTESYCISSVQGYKPFEHGHQQHLMNVAFGQKGAQFYVNHPGERPFSGGNRPSYWAGNGTNPYVEQYNNVIIMLFHIDKGELVHSIHGYTPLYDYEEHKIIDKWLFLRSGNGYVGAYFHNGVALTLEGVNTKKEVTSQGLNNLVVIKCGSLEEFGSFAEFIDKVKGMGIAYDGNLNVVVKDIQYGEIKIEKIRELKVNNNVIEYCYKPKAEIKKGNLLNA